jgi:HSP20 family protein
MTSLTPFKMRTRDLRSEVWDSFSDFFSDNFFAPVRSNTHLFRTDIKDDGNRYIIEAELPGFEKDEIKVDYDQQYLTISAQREAVNKEEKDHYIRQERLFGEFVRRFYVEDIDRNMIEASFKNGILTISCPKLMIEKTDRKMIEIH